MKVRYSFLLVLLFLSSIALTPISASTQRVTVTNSSWRFFADPSETDQGVTGNGETIKAHIDSITSGDDDTIVLVPGSYTITTNIVVPAGVKLLMQEGAVFAGTGTIDLSSSANDFALPEWWGIDGTADDVEINEAITAMGGKEVRLYSPTYTTSGTISLESNTRLRGIAQGGTVITYSGTGSGISVLGASNVRLSDFHINTSDNAANGIRIAQGSRQVAIDNLLVNSQATSSTGAGFLFDDNGSWTGGIVISNCKVNTYKFGVKLVNASTTVVSFVDVWLIGNAGSVVDGSAGIYVDGNAGGVGSTFWGGTIESFDTGIEVLSGSKGISANCDFEGNNTNYSLSDTYNGRIESPQGGWFIEKGTNAGANVWYQEKHQSGVYTRETYYDQRHVIFGPGTRYWGVFSNGSYIDGDDIYPQGGFKISNGHTIGATPEHYYMFLRDRRLSFSTAQPTNGAWSQGSIIFDTTVTASNSPGWVCVHSGTFGNATDNTGDTEVDSAIITGMTDTSDFKVGDWVDVSAGFPGSGPYKILEITSTTITIDEDCTSQENNVTVDTTDPTFKTMANVSS